MIVALTLLSISLNLASMSSHAFLSGSPVVVLETMSSTPVMQTERWGNTFPRTDSAVAPRPWLDRLASVNLVNSLKVALRMVVVAVVVVVVSERLVSGEW